jgi:short-subunit dehydrogenase
MIMYTSAKAAIISMMESLRLGLAPHGIGVSVLCPGPIKSNIHQLSQNRPDKFAAGQGFVAAAERLGKRQVSDVWMEPDEVGDMVVEAIRNDSLYIITHGEWREAFKARADAILAAMPTKTDPALLASFKAMPGD